MILSQCYYKSSDIWLNKFEIYITIIRCALNWWELGYPEWTNSPEKWEMCIQLNGWVSRTSGTRAPPPFYYSIMQFGGCQTSYLWQSWNRAAVSCSPVAYMLGGVKMGLGSTGKPRRAWHRCMGGIAHEMGFIGSYMHHPCTDAMHGAACPSTPTPF